LRLFKTAYFIHKKTRLVFLSKLRGILFELPPKLESLLCELEEFTRRIHYLFIVSYLTVLNSTDKAKIAIEFTKIFVRRKHH